MNGTLETGSQLITATYATAAVYFAIVAVLAVVINVSIIIVYCKNKKVSFQKANMFFFCRWPKAKELPELLF